MMSNFIRGFLDGAIAALGVVIGASAADPTIIVSAVTGAAVANGAANVFGAFTAEKAYAYKEMEDIEKAMVSRSLRGSLLEKSWLKETQMAGLSDGVGTVLGGFIPVLPFLALPAGDAVAASVGLVLLLLFSLGVYMGILSKKNIVVSGAKFLLFAAATAGAVYLLQNVIMA